jgi:hypothetical protein
LHQDADISLRAVLQVERSAPAGFGKLAITDLPIPRAKFKK